MEGKWEVFINGLIKYEAVTFKAGNDIFQITTGDDRAEWTVFDENIKKLFVFDDIEKCCTEKIFNGKSLKELILIDDIPYDYM